MGVSAATAAKIGTVATNVGSAIANAASSKAGQAAISGATGMLISKATTPPKDAPEEAGDFGKIHLGYPQEIK